MAEAKPISVPKLNSYDELDAWISDMRVWQCETDVKKNKQGPTIYMALGYVGQECCKDIEVDDFVSDDGPEFIISALVALYNCKNVTSSEINFQEKIKISCEHLQGHGSGSDTDSSLTTEFIQLTSNNVEKDKRLQHFLSIFPDRDVEYLRKKSEEFGFTDKGETKCSAWIEQELLNMDLQEKANDRYLTLRAFFPENEEVFLLEKCHEYSFNEAGTEEFNAWIEDNKKTECLVCFDPDCLDSEMISCRRGHLFCKECVQRGSNVAIGDGKPHLSCLTGNCTEMIDIASLEKCLDRDVFSKWISKMQADEVERAGIEGVEQCPFCPFVQVMNQSVELEPLFVCQHPDCSNQSCRLCKDIPHPSLRCDQVEKDAEVEKRTYIEGKMTEALIRVCYNCKKPFIKQDGCNRMQCNCGASMCYLCREPVMGYDHFVGQGAVPNPPHQVCPLWSNNDELHLAEVARGGLSAKEEMERKRPGVPLKIDPTSGNKQ